MTAINYFVLIRGLQIVGTLMLLSGCYTLLDQWRVQRWPRTKGWVLHLKWRAKEQNYEVRGQTYWYTRQSADFAYKYRVNGVDYIGRAVHHPIWPWSWNGRAVTKDYFEIEDFLDRHSHGNEIEVIYRDAEPADCLLAPSRGILPYAVIVVGAFALLGGAALDWPLLIP